MKQNQFSLAAFHFLLFFLFLDFIWLLRVAGLESIKKTHQKVYGLFQSLLEQVGICSQHLWGQAL